MTLKPTDKKAGYGVVTNIPNEKRMLISVKKMLKLEDIKPVLIEEFFEGVTYRVLVVSGQIFAILKYIPASILGDGVSSIEELIKAKNLISKSRVRINNALRLSIFNDGKTWETVLPKDEKYIISHNSHASNAGQSINVTELFDKKYKQVVTDVCKSLDLKIAGFDMIVNSKGDYRIIEINCGPALAIHVNPKYGTSLNSYTEVLYSLLEETDIEKKENSYLKELIKYHK
jgi:D-alanine-D-alanine ligase-like ATP-grasp enzyme